MIQTLSAVAALSAAGYCYQYFGTKRDEKEFPPPGDLIDVGGYKLHINTQGEAPPGVPTIIIETGFWDYSQSWQFVQPKLAKMTRVCTYDRAGYGWSEPGPHPRTFDQMAHELKTLLEKKGIQPPYILVGHSLGGPIARYYHSQYPDDVAGMVFVDALHLQPPELTHSRFLRIMTVALYTLALVGVVRLLLNFVPTKYPYQWKASDLKTCLGEWDGYSQSFQQLREQRKSIKEMRVTLISRDPELPRRPGMSPEAIRKEREALDALHQEQLEDAGDAPLVIAKGSGHEVHIDKPEVIIEEIRKMLSTDR